MGKNKTRKNQKGGVISIGDSPEETFTKFIAGATVRYLATGVSGIVFVCENTQSSDYYAFRPNDLAKNVHKIIIKLVIIHEDDHQEMLKIDLEDFITINEQAFRYEIDCQRAIVDATCAFFDPSMPTILYDTIREGFDIVDMLTSKAINPRTAHMLAEYKKGLSNLHLKTGLIAMEHAGIDETFIPMHLMYRVPGINILQIEALAMYELIVLAVAGFYHGDHHSGNLLYSDNSRKEHFLSEDGSTKWYTGKCILPIDAGRVSRLDRLFRRQSPPGVEHNMFKVLIQQFIETGDPIYLREMIRMIMNGGYDFSHEQDLKNHQVYSWFNKSGEQLREIAQYVHELIIARQRAVQQVIERTTETVSITLDGSQNMNDIKQLILREIQKRNVTVEFILSKLKLKVIEDTREQIVQAYDVASLQRKIHEELDKDLDKELDEEQEKKGGDGPNDFIKFIEPIDFNELVNISCFAIIFATYLTGKLNEVEPTFLTLAISLEQPSFKQPYDYQRGYEEEKIKGFMPQPLSVSAGGGKRKKSRKKRKITARKRQNKKF
jgi:hypothetical protein